MIPARVTARFRFHRRVLLVQRKRRLQPRTDDAGMAQSPSMSIHTNTIEGKDSIIKLSTLKSHNHKTYRCQVQTRLT